MASDQIRADMVETTEFPHLVQKYEVQGVPHTVINDFYGFVGPLSELETSYEILRAIGKEAPPIKVSEEQVEGVPYPHGHHHHEHEHAPEKPKSQKKKKASGKKAGKKSKKK